MTTENNTPMTSSELGALWLTYETKTMMLRIINYFISTSEDTQIRKILNDYSVNAEKFISELNTIFENEKAIVPMGITDEDVHLDAPPLFDDTFAPIFLRVLMKMNLGFHGVHLGMAHREDLRQLFERLLMNSSQIYNSCTSLLLEKGFLTKLPYVSMPKEREFIEEKKYMSGIKFGGNKRALNTIEVGYICLVIEINQMVMQLMTGFAQIAKESEVKKYFIEGKEMAKKTISILSNILLESDIQPLGSGNGRATDSVTPVFSDKLMLVLTNLLCSYSLGNTALGGAFSMRDDLPNKLQVISNDILQYAHKGGKLMIKHRWMEEPPQMEDRNKLTKSRKS